MAEKGWGGELIAQLGAPASRQAEYLGLQGCSCPLSLKGRWVVSRGTINRFNRHDPTLSHATPD